MNILKVIFPSEKRKLALIPYQKLNAEFQRKYENAIEYANSLPSGPLQEAADVETNRIYTYYKPLLDELYKKVEEVT